MAAQLDVVQHLDDLWRYARVLTRNDGAAEDLVQEALTRALSLAATYDQSRPLLPWLVAIVRNTYLAGRSRESAERRRLSDVAVLADTSQAPPQEHSAELQTIRRALDTLPTEQAEVLHLVGVLGFAYADAAKVLGIPKGTVMSRLSRARQALKDAVERPSSAYSGLRVVGGRK